MVAIDPEIRAAWQSNPDEPIDLILRVAGDISQLVATLEQRGITVKRRFRLTNSLAVRCNGRTALQLLNEPWITHIDVDRPVKAFRR